MKKPAWISVIGWVTVFWCLFVGVSWIGAVAGNWPMKAVEGLTLGTLFCFPPLGLWLIATMIHKFQVSKVRMQAAVIRDQIKRTMPAAVPGNGAARVPVAVGGAVPVTLCARCKTAPAVVGCKDHGIALCAGCISTHSQPGLCNFLPIMQPAPEQPRARARRKSVMTSPLDLTGTDT